MKKITQEQIDNIMALSSCIITGLCLIGLICMGIC